MEKNSKTLLIFIISVFMISGAATALKSNIVDMSISSDGSTVTSFIRAQGVSDVAGYQLQLSYDPSFLQADKLIYGDFLGEQNELTCGNAHIENGVIKDAWCVINCFNKGCLSKTGSGLLAKIKFSCLKEGETEIKFSVSGGAGSMLSDSNANALNVEFRDAMINCGSVQTVPPEDSGNADFDKGWTIIFVHTYDNIKLADIENACSTPQSPIVAFSLENNKLKSASYLETGNAYLVRISKKCNIPFTQPQISISKLVLTKGWNVIGTTKTIGVDIFKASCSSDALIYDLKGGKLSPLKHGESMQENTGYLIRVPDACSVDL